jgi:ABC-type nickel/cobalt efflux system permease component RcnA
VNHSQQPKQQHKQDPHRHNHSAVMVGVLHGAAGSAPLLVLIPLAKLTSPVYGVIYLLCFSGGVLICMAIFGGMIDKLYRWLAMRGNDTVKILRFTIASSAIVFGGFLLAGV